MEPINVLTSKAVPLPLPNIDTDQIIPKQFLKRMERTGYGAGVVTRFLSAALVAGLLVQYPVGALSAASGPAVGELAPRMPVTTLDGREIAIGARHSSGAASLLLFVSAHCPICKVVIPVAKDFAVSERVHPVFVADSTLDELRGLIDRFSLHELDVVNSAQLGLQFQVAKLPYAVLLAADGTVVAKGLVNSREHLESLVTAHELGVVSVQDYLKQSKSPHSKTKVA